MHLCEWYQTMLLPPVSVHTTHILPRTLCLLQVALAMLADWLMVVAGYVAAESVWYLAGACLTPSNKCTWLCQHAGPDGGCIPMGCTSAHSMSVCVAPVLVDSEGASP